MVLEARRLPAVEPRHQLRALQLRRPRDRRARSPRRGGSGQGQADRQRRRSAAVPGTRGRRHPGRRLGRLPRCLPGLGDGRRRAPARRRRHRTRRLPAGDAGLADVHRRHPGGSRAARSGVRLGRSGRATRSSSRSSGSSADPKLSKAPWRRTEDPSGAAAPALVAGITFP